MTQQTRFRTSLSLRLATVAVSAGLVAGIAGMTASTPPARSATGSTAAVVAPTPAAPVPISTASQVAASADPAASLAPSRVVPRSGSATTAVRPAKTVVRPAAARRTIYIRSYLDRMGSQAAVDTGRLVLWYDKPYWLAGHNYRGWQWMAFVPTGAKVIVTTGRAAGTYLVTGHKRLDRQSGPMPEVKADLVLQTCVRNQTGLTLLKRISR